MAKLTIYMQRKLTTADKLHSRCHS